jgi:hypothetical protein
MFSNKLITLKVVSTVILLIVLGAVAQHIGRSQDAKTNAYTRVCVLSYSQCLNELLVIRFRIINWSPELSRAQVKIGESYLTDRQLYIVGVQGPLKTGEGATGLGYFNENGRFIIVKQSKEKWIQTTKYMVSLFGLAFSLFLLSTQYSFTPGKRFPIVPKSRPV